MGWILLLALEAVAPVCDLMEGSLQAANAIRYAGEVKIQSNIETDDSEISQHLLMKSGQRLLNWRIVASEWLLIVHHGEKFDFKNKQRPLITLEPTTQESKYCSLVISFPEKATGLRAEQERIDKLCEEAAIQFVKALHAKDHAGAGKNIAVPWLAENERVIRDRTEVDAPLQALMAHATKFEANLAKSPSTWRYSQLRPELGRHEARKILDEVLGRDGRIVNLSSVGPPFALRNIFVRVDNGVARIVGGPYKFTYLVMENILPLSVKQALENATTFELLSLNPVPIAEKEKPGFYGYEVLGRTQLKGAATQKQVVAAFQQAIEESEGLEACCFNPRHGFRIAYDKKMYDFVICYECMQIRIYEDGKPLKGVLTTGSAQPVLDRVLQQAGVPLAEKSK